MSPETEADKLLGKLVGANQELRAADGAQETVGHHEDEDDADGHEDTGYRVVGNGGGADVVMVLSGIAGQQEAGQRKEQQTNVPKQYAGIVELDKAVVPGHADRDEQNGNIGQHKDVERGKDCTPRLPFKIEQNSNFQQYADEVKQLLYLTI